MSIAKDALDSHGRNSLAAAVIRLTLWSLRDGQYKDREFRSAQVSLPDATERAGDRIKANFTMTANIHGKVTFQPGARGRITVTVNISVHGRQSSHTALVNRELDLIAWDKNWLSSDQIIAFFGNIKLPKIELI